jgi:hypothetical protein
LVIIKNKHHLGGFYLQNTCFSYTPNEIKDLMKDFFIKRYNYDPIFTITFDTGVWLPIEIEFELNQTEEFLSFWESLHYDLFKISDQHTGDKFETGDKIFQMIVGHPTIKYIFDKNDTYHSETIIDDDAPAYILVDDKKSISYVSDNEHKRKVELFKERLNRFSFTRVDFEKFETYLCKLVNFELNFEDDMEEDSIELCYSYEDKNIEVKIIFKEALHTFELKNISIEVNACCNHEVMFKETERIGESITSLFKNHPKYRLFNLYENFVTLKNVSIIIPGCDKQFKELSPKENAILYFYKKGASYKEILEALHIEDVKRIDNLIQRMKRKINHFGLKI